MGVLVGARTSTGDPADIDTPEPCCEVRMSIDESVFDEDDVRGFAWEYFGPPGPDLPSEDIGHQFSADGRLTMSSPPGGPYRFTARCDNGGEASAEIDLQEDTDLLLTPSG